MTDVPTSPPATPTPSPLFVHVNSKGKPLGTLENFKALMNSCDIQFRYNEMTHQIDIEHAWISPNPDNRFNVFLAHIESYAAQYGFPLGRVADYVTVLADQNSYHPVRKWLLSKPWDEQDRLQALMDTIKTPTPQLRDIFLYRWLISAVAALFEPHFWSKGVLVFQGEQNVGKTSWFRQLIPINSGFGLEGVSLDPNNKDSVNRTISHWLIELGELESTLRRDLQQLKAFISCSVDNFRKPYARDDSHYPRRTVLFGSVNGEQFLRDNTGNSRFWCLNVTALDYQHAIDMQQLWAQIAVEYNAGEPWHLNEQEANTLIAHNKAFEEIDPIEELVLSYYPHNGAMHVRKTATEVLLNIGYVKPNQAETTRCGRILTRLYGPSKKSNGRSLFTLPIEN